jgi:ketosteroid isomerase-like protein
MSISQERISRCLVTRRIISVAYRAMVTEDAAAGRRLSARRAIEAIWTGADPAATADLYDDAFVGRSNLSDVVVEGPAEVRRYTQQFAAAIGDLRFEILEQISEGDTVVTRWIADGDGLAPLLEDLVDSDGGPIRAGGITMHRFKGERIVESWTYWDATGAPPSKRALRLLRGGED